jgi:hypothetical protein
MLTGCGTSSAIKSAQEFGSLSEQFEDNTNKLANDIYDSCIRRVRYIQMDDPVSNDARDEALKQCEELNKPASEQARDANRVMIDYMRAVGELASDNIVSFDDQFTKIEESLNNFSIPTGSGTNVSLPEGFAKTGVKIANFIFSWAAKSYREGTLREAITCTDEPVQTYTSGLKYAFQEGYINGLLQQELFRVNSYYNDYAALLRARKGTDQEFRDLQKESFDAIQPVLQKRNAALSYIEIIDATANAHADLAKLFLKHRNPPADSVCQAYFGADQTNKALSSKTQKSFNNADSALTVEELTEVKQIATDYQKEVEPLLSRMSEELNN